MSDNPDDLFRPIKNEHGRKPEADQDIVYYYSREHRMQRASTGVRELNENAGVKQGIIKNLIGNKSNITVLVSIAIICLMAFFITISGGQTGAQVKLGENNVSMTIYDEGGILFLSLHKEFPSKIVPYTGAVDIAVSPVQTGKEVPPIETRRIFFSLDTPENYLVSLPFEGDKFLVALHTDFQTITRSLIVSKKGPAAR
ncbi:MAG: hypothetical protein FWD78_04165 [Treponema sp.]|nr:hypothetical protein [Treponema sp.]